MYTNDGIVMMPFTKNDADIRDVSPNNSKYKMKK